MAGGVPRRQLVVHGTDSRAMTETLQERKARIKAANIGSAWRTSEEGFEAARAIRDSMPPGKTFTDDEFQAALAKAQEDVAGQVVPPKMFAWQNAQRTQKCVSRPKHPTADVRVDLVVNAIARHKLLGDRKQGNIECLVIPGSGFALRLAEEASVHVRSLRHHQAGMSNLGRMLQTHGIPPGKYHLHWDEERNSYWTTTDDLMDGV